MASADASDENAGSRTGAARRWFQRSYLGQSLERALEVQITDRMMALAAQAFLAILPLVMIVSAVAPSGVSKGMADGLHRHFGLHGSAADNVQQITRTAQNSGVTALGFLIVLFSATSFSRALQRLYERAWRLEPAGLRSAWRPLAWILGIVAYLIVIGFALYLTHGGGALTVLRGVVTFAGSLALWWWTPFVLLSGRVTWRALAPTSAFTAVGTLVLTFVSSAYVPRTMSSNEARYGTIGVAFTLESWLVVFSAVLCGATVLGAVAATWTGRIGGLARGAPGADSWRRTARPRR